MSAPQDRQVIGEGFGPTFWTGAADITFCCTGFWTMTAPGTTTTGSGAEKWSDGPEYGGGCIDFSGITF